MRTHPTKTEYARWLKKVADLVSEPLPDTPLDSMGSIPEVVDKIFEEDQRARPPIEIPAWNYFNALTQGLRLNAFTILCGPTGCLSGETMISINRAGKGAKLSMRELYLRTAGIAPGRKFDPNIPTMVRSWNGVSVQLHRVKDVFLSGIKETWRFKFGQNKTIRATPCHKFLTKRGWIRGAELQKGDRVAMDIPRPRKTVVERAKRYDSYITGIKYHPYATKCGQDKRLVVHRAIFEAKLNRLDLQEFKRIIRHDPLRAETLKYVNPKTHHIHHKNHDHYDNSPENLEALPVCEHGKKHGDHMNFGAGRIQWIEYLGHDQLGVEAVYDIECEDPHHNFVANGIVVHNSGKTTFLANLAAQLAAYETPVFVASVETGDTDFVRKMASIVGGFDAYGPAAQGEIRATVKAYPGIFSDERHVFSNYDSRIPHRRLLADILFAHEMNGTKVALVDNLNFLLEVGDAKEAIQGMDRAIHDFVVFCKRTPIHVVMVMHPRKTEGGRVESEFDIKGSSTAVQEASNVMLWNRVKQEDYGHLPLGINDPRFCRELRLPKMRKGGRGVGTRIFFSMADKGEALREQSIV